MKWVKWTLCLLIVSSVGAGGYALLFPRGHANPNISEDDAAHIANELGITVGTSGSEGGISAVFGAASGIPSLKASSGGDALPGFMRGETTAPAFIAAATQEELPTEPPALVVAAPAFAAPAPLVAAPPLPPVANPVAPLEPLPPLSETPQESTPNPLPSTTTSRVIRPLPPVGDTCETSAIVLASLSPPSLPSTLAAPTTAPVIADLADFVPMPSFPTVSSSLPLQPLTQPMPREPLDLGNNNALRNETASLTPLRTRDTNTESVIAPLQEPVSETRDAITANNSGNNNSGNTDAGNELRDKVVRYIQAQCVMIDAGDPRKVSEGYVHLSRLYEHPDMSRAERTFLEPILEQLATDIIYSPTSHILEPPYTVRDGETLETIATVFEISPQLLLRINGLHDASDVRTGMQLKVFRGPFDAKVLSSEKKLYIVLGGLYAGRADVTGETPLCHTLEGDFAVKEKAVLAPGVFWIGLGGDTGLISTNQPERIQSQTVFILPTLKMAELHELLQTASTVSIVR